MLGWLLILGCGAEPDYADYETDCSDGWDNDRDGLADCLDPDCQQASHCVASREQFCEDGVDNDHDGLIDCQDSDCWLGCGETDCADGVDNNSDGYTDCYDSDCAQDAVCQEDCSDGLDNDADELVDCQDPDCTAACAEDCHDGIDNDADGRIDCQDSECPEECFELDCADGIDNDFDGDRDCWDSDCEGADACLEQCFDGVDNDKDGALDCEDADCAEQCTEQLCSDGEDEDADGLIDCDDADCWGTTGCSAALSIQPTGGEDMRYARRGYTLPGGTTSQSWAVSFQSAHGWALTRNNSSSALCDWSAQSFRVRYASPSWEAPSRQLSASGFQSTGACLWELDAQDLAVDDRTQTWPFTVQIDADYIEVYHAPSSALWFRCELHREAGWTHRTISGSSSSQYTQMTVSSGTSPWKRAVEAGP